MSINSVKSYIDNEINNTLFLGKSLDDFLNFKKLGVDYQLICSQGSEQSIIKHPDIFVHEKEIGIRKFSTSKFFEIDIFEYSSLVSKLKTSKNIWCYQAYPWTNDLKFLKKKVFAIDYFLFLKLSNKFSQLEILKNSNSKELSEHIKYRNILLKTKFGIGDMSLSTLPMVISKSFSNGGDGISLILSGQSFFSRGVSKSEKFIPHEYTVNQMGVVFADSIIKYPPSIQILDSKLKYLGSSYDLGKGLPKNILRKLTNITNLVGKTIKKLGYRGIFGCDYIVSKEEKVIFIELNPRYQASSFVLNQLSWKEDHLSPHFLHIASFLTSAEELKIVTNKNEYIPIPKSTQLSYIKLKKINIKKCIPKSIDVFTASKQIKLETGANNITLLGSYNDLMIVAREFLI